MKISGNKMLITGGGSGIGLGLTERFIQNQNKVIICGRRASVLEEAQARFPGLITRMCDLTEPAEREALVDWISREHPDLNVLINNAGIQNWMSITDEHFLERAKEEININVEAPIHLTSLMLKLNAMDTVINITSGLSFAPLAKVPVYSATKAFLHSYTWALRHLVKEKSIEVIEIIPPAINTDLGGKGIHDFAPPVHEFMDAVFQQLKEGKSEITFGYTESLASTVPEAWKQAFSRMNPTS
jgi:uncharacterized oxidoreductase